MGEIWECVVIVYCYELWAVLELREEEADCCFDGVLNLLCFSRGIRDGGQDVYIDLCEEYCSLVVDIVDSEEKIRFLMIPYSRWWPRATIQGWLICPAALGMVLMMLKRLLTDHGLSKRYSLPSTTTKLLLGRGLASKASQVEMVSKTEHHFHSRRDWSVKGVEYNPERASVVYYHFCDLSLPKFYSAI